MFGNHHHTTVAPAHVSRNPFKKHHAPATTHTRSSFLGGHRHSTTTIPHAQHRASLASSRGHYSTVSTRQELNASLTECAKAKRDQKTYHDCCCLFPAPTHTYPEDWSWCSRRFENPSSPHVPPSAPRCSLSLSPPHHHRPSLQRHLPPPQQVLKGRGLQQGCRSHHEFVVKPHFLF